MGRLVLLDHVRSSILEAAKAANFSAVSPASRARSVRRMGSHHSAGIESLCGHLRAADTPTPISAAKLSGEPHKATTSLKLETMTLGLGQTVPKIKPLLSRDRKNLSGHNVCMADDDEEVLREALAARVKAARAGRTQDAMAELLKIKQSAYSKYENRGSIMPPWHLLKFAKICDVRLEWLMAGQEPMRDAPRAVKEPARPAPKKKAAG